MHTHAQTTRKKIYLYIMSIIQVDFDLMDAINNNKYDLLQSWLSDTMNKIDCDGKLLYKPKTGPIQHLSLQAIIYLEWHQCWVKKEGPTYNSNPGTHFKQSILACESQYPDMLCLLLQHDAILPPQKPNIDQIAIYTLGKHMLQLQDMNQVDKSTINEQTQQAEELQKQEQRLILTISVYKAKIQQQNQRINELENQVKRLLVTNNSNKNRIEKQQEQLQMLEIQLQKEVKKRELIIQKNMLQREHESNKHVNTKSY